MRHSLFVTFTALLLSSTSAFAQQPTIFGAWCGAIGNGWPYDTPSRDLVVEQDGTCRWDLPKASPNKAKTCSVKPGELTLITGADSKVGLKLKSDDTLDGWFELKSGGKIYKVTAKRGACKS